MKHLQPFDNYQPISESLEYHIKNSLSLFESVYRVGSDAWLQLVIEARDLFRKGLIDLDEADAWLTSTEVGERAVYEGESVLLDLPFISFEEGEIDEAKYHGKEVELNKPKRGGTKKYHVYVRNPQTGKIMKVAFGDVHGGKTAKVADPKARKSFAARHQCHKKKDKTKAGYWACRVNRYANIFGKSYPGYW